MFGIGMPELIIIFVIALLVFGPKELPKIGRTIGKAMGEFRRASDELRDGIQREIELADRGEQTPAPPLVQEPPIPAGAEATAPAPEEPPGDAEVTTAVGAASVSPEVSEPKEPPGESGEPSPPAEFSPRPSPQPVETRNA
jgi:TatA/E family protein of Tat protein translocase